MAPNVLWFEKMAPKITWRRFVFRDHPKYCTRSSCNAQKVAQNFFGQVWGNLGKNPSHLKILPAPTPTYCSKSELQHCCCGHVTHKSKAKVKQCTQLKMHGSKRVWWERGVRSASDALMCMIELWYENIEKAHRKIKVSTDLRMFMKM